MIKETISRDVRTDLLYKEFSFDTRAEYVGLPSACAINSKADCLEDGSEWRLNGAGAWIEQPSIKKILTEIYDEMSQYPHDLSITVGAGTTLTVKRTSLGGAVADNTTFSESGIVYNRDALEITVLPEGSTVEVNGVLLEGTGYIVGTGSDIAVVSAVGGA
ncbi:MAG: hypothetical protein ACYCWE_09590 [Eubacteriales bacterium]